MARCGCKNQCACALVAGAGVVVLGTGGVTDPYVVSADSGNVTVLDTRSVDLSIVGQGEASDPYQLQAAVKRSSDSGNALQERDGGLFVPAAAAGLTSTGGGVKGVGTEASPVALNLAAYGYSNAADGDVVGVAPDGTVRGAPKRYVIAAVAPLSEVTTNFTNSPTGTTVTAPYTSVTVTNPSAVRPMQLRLTSQARFQYAVQDAATGRLDTFQTTQRDGVTLESASLPWVTIAQGNDSRVVTLFYDVTLAAGASTTLRVSAADTTGYNYAGLARIVSCSLLVNGWSV